MNVTVVLRTLADHQAFTLRAFCQACDRAVELDQTALAARFGGDILLEAVKRRLRCQQCGRRAQRLVAGYHRATA